VSAQYTLTTREDRARARRRRSRRHMAISGISAVVVLGGLAALILTASGWPTFRRTFLSGHWFNASIGSILSGFWLDARMFLIIEVGVLALALVIALIRTLDMPVLFPLKLICIAFVDVMRGVPTILLIYLFGFGVPTLSLKGLPTDPVVLGGIALGLNYSAYVSEVLRAGLMSVHPSQGSAALALGLTPAQALRTVIVPQAVRNVVPPLLNDFIALTKDVALVSIIGPQEAARVAQIFQDQNFNFTPLMAAAAVYLCVTIPLIRVVDHLQWRRIRQRGTVMALGPR
jgi:polar amino acid transport system permease protein